MCWGGQVLPRDRRENGCLELMVSSRELEAHRGPGLIGLMKGLCGPKQGSSELWGQGVGTTDPLTGQGATASEIPHHVQSSLAIVG